MSAVCVLASVWLLMAGASASDQHLSEYPSKFEVENLPGWTDAQGNPAPLPSKLFTGFINAGVPPSGVGSMYFHYWMIESESDPTSDPIIIWYNGGPGASSLYGPLEEFGPLTFNVDSFDKRWSTTGVPTPQRNAFSWSKKHTIIAIDSPPPMGLSFCSHGGPGGKPTDCGAWTDSSVFKANHVAHKVLFNDIIPERKSNPIFFFGESYGGIYIPGFINELLADPIAGLNLKGFGVGNGWTGCKLVPGKPKNWCINLDNVGVFKYPNVYPGPWYDVEFFHGHSYYSNELYLQIRAQCPEKELRGEVALTTECSGLIDQMSDEIGFWFPYNIYNECPNGTEAFRLGRRTATADKHGRNAALRARTQMYKSLPSPPNSGLASACIGSAMAEWLANNETQKAVGIPAGMKFINLDNGHGFNYTSDREFVGDIYEHAIKAGLRVLVYEGDVDGCGLQTMVVEDVFVSHFKDMGLERTGPWRPWTTNGAQQMGGYVIEWENGKAQFVSIRGAGHLSPHNRPQATEVMLDYFTQDKQLPIYVKPPTHKGLLYRG